MQDITSTAEKNGPASLTILMAMRIRRYGTKCISRYGSRGSTGQVPARFFRNRKNNMG